MSAEEENAFCDDGSWEGAETAAEPEVVDHFSNMARAASLVGDLRNSLLKEGFTKQETFYLVATYWASEMGAFG
ncbi:DUF7187 family protein [Streptomyces sp. H34-S4]|uniref:DUF7187 family protein n=1 Tax=Streptomyces sp. H34-S4 TaxID=2996463 RepID=UPI0022706335|nr:hypothetical protein [Streptomyces sp. H34-S4]MCY0933603.1 hypothetical protein [Streptomyces sp. H34-S4]